MTPKSGNESISLTGPVVGQGGTAGHLPGGYAVREFQIERVLGEGGFSVVYLATDTRLERQVAIKEYMPTALATRNPDLSVHVRSSAQHREAFDAGLRSFINEAKLLARFEHRALVKVHQFWQEKGTAYMVMPFYSGPTLKSWIKQQLVPVDSAWLEQFLRLVMDALETLHKENCLHRDVAPDNILILNERAPLLLDFGAARRVIGDLTQALTVILKPGFAPIEQYAESQSMRQGPWTDVYALCAVAHFMITGRAPTPSVTRVLADDLVPLQTAAAGRFSPAFLAALDAGLTVRPQQRPQSIGALRDMMNGVTAPDDTLTAPPATRFTSPPPPGPIPTTLRPIPMLAEPDDGEDDKTRIVTTRDLPLPTGSDTISSPSVPAFAPFEAAGTTPDLTGDPTFESRFPSRSMREHEAAVARGDAEENEDRASKLPFIIGGVAIALVIGAAWATINWLNNEMVRSRQPSPAVTPAPAPSSTSQTTAPPPIAAAPPPAPVVTPAPAPVSSAPAPAPVATTAAPPQAAQVAPVPSVQTAAPTAAEKPALPPATRPPSSEAQSSPADKTPALTVTSKPSTPPAVKPTPTAPVQMTTAAAPAPPAPMKSAPSPEPRGTASTAGAPSKAGPASGNETPRPRSPQPSPSEMTTAPSVSLPPVAKVEASTPGPVAALDPARGANTPAAQVAAPLRPVSRPSAMFPREALRAGVDQGRVVARLYVSPDGTVNKVDIVSAQPPRLFDREVRETAQRWRYEPPGQPRQVDVEFAFDASKDR